MTPCGSYSPASGIGTHCTPTGRRASRGQAVSSYAIDDGEQLLLFDPLAAPTEILELAANREPLIVLTAPWHEHNDLVLWIESVGAVVSGDTLVDLAGDSRSRRSGYGKV